MSDYKVLVVDDELVWRESTRQAICKEGLSCDTAEDGQSAWEMVQQTNYDLVVSDLRMPQRNGHSLIVDLLQMQPRPCVAVLTALSQPRLVQDLFARGVDCIEFKPVSLRLFATKMRALLERRRNQPAVVDATPPGGPIDSAAWEARLAAVADVPTISPAMIELLSMSAGTASASDTSLVLSRDPGLVIEVLRLANSSYYNPGGNAVTDLDAAIVRIGQKAVRQIAVTCAVQACFDRDTTQFDKYLVWRQSLAAAIASEYLPREAGSADLFLCALVHQLGRLTLAKIYPQHYTALFDVSQQCGRPLLELEAEIFLESHASAMAKLLARWRIPEELFRPLRYVTDSFEQTGELDPELRAEVHCLKVASCIGRIVAGEPSPWESIEVPPADVTESMLPQLATILELTSRGLSDSLSADIKNAALKSRRAGSPPARGRLAYSTHSPVRFDFLGSELTSLGYELQSGHSAPGPNSAAPRVVNCIDAPPGFLDEVNLWRTPALVIVRQADPIPAGFPHRLLRLPCSLQELRAGVEAGAETSS